MGLRRRSCSPDKPQPDGHTCVHCAPAVNIIGVSVQILRGGTYRAHLTRVHPATKRMQFAAPLTGTYSDAGGRDDVEILAEAVRRVLLDPEVRELLR